ncbi:DUF2254 domain-containing protein [Paractinoplanes globisporus]|uniref:DUF2254 domain-containing protein n=1 Tax=Paractinoplanes globisporus TaxID=113565 RepID=A0ABW6WTK3_9ACTN|nr:DUF2254 domain-containing protein [Actinoplanes globisporus]
MMSREHVRDSLWVLPALSVVGALGAGAVLSAANLDAGSPLAFQGTPDDARTLLIGIAGTMVTVIALLLGLTVVALQLSSTQYSPRLLRNFLRDRPNQLVLSACVATFAYSTAGLYTVGVSGGSRTTEFPRLAVTGAIVLLFVSLGMLVFFADHLGHSIQIDSIMAVVERNTLAVIRGGLLEGGGTGSPVAATALAVPAPRSGYVQVVRVERMLAAARGGGLRVRLRPRPGEHVVAGTTLLWIWPATTARPAATATVPEALVHAVHIGRERTFDQDAAFGFRQLTDMACKALSPAVNDPYTAVQAIERLSVLFRVLATRPLGCHVDRDPGGAEVTVPGWTFGEYLATMSGLIRRYGAAEPTVVTALLRLLSTCAAVDGPDPGRPAAIEEQARLLVEDAEREVRQPADLREVRAAAAAVRAGLDR